MQNILRLPWCMDAAGEEKPEKAMLAKMRHQTAVDIPLLNKLKRKRADSQSLEPLPNIDDAKRRKLSEVEHNGLSLSGTRQPDVLNTDGFLDSGICNASSCAPSHPLSANFAAHTSGERPVLSNPGLRNLASTPPPSAKPSKTEETSDCPDISEEAKRSQLKEVIEHQFNLEILSKHRELRLIEQELAKCQIALEQLRRCEIVPYPGSTGLSESLSSGTGPALKPQPGFTEPRAPAPWGVSDGPYTRHYARWLLNDPSFDSMPFSHVYPTFDNYGMQVEGRSTRNSGAGLGKASKTRSTRDSVGNFSQALPNYPAQPRGKQGPLVIRRLADNQFVKLICNNCQRGDFSSVQGFLNHCRIAHKVDYKSHEAAALDCGRPLEEDEAHLIPQSAPTAAPGAPKPQAPKVVAPPVTQPLIPGFVHPLNAQVIPRNTWKRQSAAAQSAVVQPQTSRFAPCNKAAQSPAAASFHAAPLVGSSSAPRLSALFAKRGLGGDLQRATAQAREKIDLGPEPAEDEDTSPTPSDSQHPSNSSAISVSKPSAAAPKEGPQSHKGQRQAVSRPRPAPILPRHVPSSSVETPDSPNDVNLSPHAADSDPGLVSDHEDDDAASDLDEARSERHQSPAAAVSGLAALRRGACGEDMDVDIEVEDEADGHGVLIRPRSLGLQMRSSGSPSRAGAARYGEAAK